jgi:hypothetical protein
VVVVGIGGDGVVVVWVVFVLGVVCVVWVGAGVALVVLEVTLGWFATVGVVAALRLLGVLRGLADVFLAGAVSAADVAVCVAGGGFDAFELPHPASASASAAAARSARVIPRIVVVNAGISRRLQRRPGATRRHNLSALRRALGMDLLDPGSTPWCNCLTDRRSIKPRPPVPARNT